MGRFNDINDKESMKRYWANKLLNLGYWIVVFVTLVWGATAFFREEAIVVPDALIKMWTWMMGFASIVILGTILEGKFNKKVN